MSARTYGWKCWLPALLVAVALPVACPARSYSSGGRGYSSHSSGSSSFGGGHGSSGGSHSFSSGGHSFSSGGGSGSGSSHGSSGSGSGFRSGGGKSYSAGSTSGDSGRHSYTSGKSYSAGSSSPFRWSREDAAPGGTGSSSFGFDEAAARARREQSSKRDFTRFKESQNPPPRISGDSPRVVTGSDAHRTAPPISVGTYRDGYRSRIYVPDRITLSSRPTRIYSVFNPYWSRPVIVYHDSYSSLFWWWLLDRSIEDRAWWAYHHRYNMDPARYQTLLATDQQLEGRVAQLEAQQAARDPGYTPSGLDRDLMYSDQYVQHAYSNRPSTLGVIAFWGLGIPTALAVSAFFIWLIWFKRWGAAK